MHTDTADNVVAPKQTKFLRMPQVCEITGARPSTIWEWTKDHERTGFPRPVRLTNSFTAWVAEEIEEWAQKRIAESRKAA